MRSTRPTSSAGPRELQRHSHTLCVRLTTCPSPQALRGPGGHARLADDQRAQGGDGRAARPRPQTPARPSAHSLHSLPAPRRAQGAIFTCRRTSSRSSSASTRRSRSSARSSRCVLFCPPRVRTSAAHHVPTLCTELCHCRRAVSHHPATVAVRGCPSACDLRGAAKDDVRQNAQDVHRQDPGFVRQSNCSATQLLTGTPCVQANRTMCATPSERCPRSGLTPALRAGRDRVQLAITGLRCARLPPLATHARTTPPRLCLQTLLPVRA